MHRSMIISLQGYGEINALRFQVVANLWTKAIVLSHKPTCRLPVDYTQLNSTQAYLKAVAERLKKIQCSAMENQF